MCNRSSRRCLDVADWFLTMSRLFFAGLIELSIASIQCWSSLISQEISRASFFSLLHYSLNSRFITHTDDSRMNLWFWLCVCLSVCPHDKTKTAKPTITKLATGISASRVLANQLILGQKVKVQGHRVTKCKKVIEWPALTVIDMTSIIC